MGSSVLGGAGSVLGGAGWVDGGHPPGPAFDWIYLPRVDLTSRGVGCHGGGSAKRRLRRHRVAVLVAACSAASQEPRGCTGEPPAAARWGNLTTARGQNAC